MRFSNHPTIIDFILSLPEALWLYALCDGLCRYRMGVDTILLKLPR